IYCFNGVISALDAAGRAPETLRLLMDMWEAKIPMDVVSYNSAMSACERGGFWEQALELFDEMQSEGHEPTLVSYTVAMRSSRDWQTALQLFFEMLGKTLVPDEVGYSTAISAVSRDGPLEWPLRLLRTMEQDGLRP
ncbi:unnamed protein product, partial [Prorocentrum cordatum]